MMHGTARYPAFLSMCLVLVPQQANRKVYSR